MSPVICLAYRNVNIGVFTSLRSLSSLISTRVQIYLFIYFKQKQKSRKKDLTLSKMNEQFQHEKITSHMISTKKNSGD